MTDAAENHEKNTFEIPCRQCFSFPPDVITYLWKNPKSANGFGENDVEDFYCFDAYITNGFDDGSFITIDIVLENLPNIKKLRYQNYDEVWSSQTLQRLIQKQLCKKMEYCCFAIAETSTNNFIPSLLCEWFTQNPLCTFEVFSNFSGQTKRIKAAVKKFEKNKDKKFKAALPALTLTVKKGAAPPPGFHDLDNHYLSSRSPPATAKLIEDKYGSPPPETKAKKVRHTSTTSTEKVYSPKPQNVFTFGTAAVKTQPPKPEPSTKVPIGYRPVEPMVVKTFEGPKYSEVLKTAEEPKPCQDIRAPETEQPKAVPPVMDINELLQSCEINNLEDDSSSEDAQDSSEEEEEDQNNDYLQDNQTTTTSETSSINSYPNDRVSISIQTEETSFSQSAYGSHRLYSASQSYIWNPAGDSNAIVNPNNERFDDYSLRRFAEESSARKTSNSSSPFNQSFYKQEEELFSPPKIIFLFRDDETFAVEVHQNGRKEMLRNGYGNEWTPMYLSMAGGSPVIGEDAKDDYQKLPNSVAYDILKVIGKPIHVIKKIYPKPKNNILLVDDTNCFVIETPYVGNRPRPEEMILAAFLKIMKEKSEKYLKAEVKSIYLSTNFELTDFQKAIFIKSASLLKLEIVSFALND